MDFFPLTNLGDVQVPVPAVKILSDSKAAPGSMAQLVFGPAPAKSVKLALEAVVSQVDGLNFPVSWQFFLTCFFKLEVTLKKIC